MAKKDTTAKVAAEPAPKAPKATKGSWRDPNWTPADTDNSIDARMRRLTLDHERMGSR